MIQYFCWSKIYCPLIIHLGRLYIHISPMASIWPGVAVSEYSAVLLEIEKKKSANSLKCVIFCSHDHWGQNDNGAKSSIFGHRGFSPFPVIFWDTLAFSSLYFCFFFTPNCPRKPQHHFRKKLRNWFTHQGILATGRDYGKRGYRRASSQTVLIILFSYMSY